MITLQYPPGAQVSIVLETAINGHRFDGYSTPFISKVILPDLSRSSIYPLDMIRIDTGIYYHRFVLPIGLAATGSYLVDAVWTDNNNNVLNQLYQIIVTATNTGGSFSVSPT